MSLCLRSPVCLFRASLSCARAGAGTAGDEGDDNEDPFQQLLLNPEHNPDGSFAPIRCDSRMLTLMNKSEVRRLHEHFVWFCGFPSLRTSHTSNLPSSIHARMQVFVQRSKCRSLARTRYFKCTIPEIKITLCGSCQSFFGLEEYEEHVLQHGACPFCRTHVDISNF